MSSLTSLTLCGVMWIGDDSIPFRSLGMTKPKWCLLKELSEVSDYWNAANKFIEHLRGVKLISLSKNQRIWLNEIMLALDDELTKKSWRMGMGRW